MLDKNTLRASRHPSLLQLRMALIAAESGSPSRPPRVTADERRALELIKKMKTEFSKPLPFTSWKDNTTLNSFRLQEVIGSYV